MKYKFSCYDGQSRPIGFIADIELRFIPRKDDVLILRSPELGILQGIVSSIVIDTTEKELSEIYLNGIEYDLQPICHGKIKRELDEAKAEAR